jgi:hypothetical protein
VTRRERREIGLAGDDEASFYVDPRGDDEPSFGGTRVHRLFEERCVGVTNAGSLLVEVRRKEMEAIVIDHKSSPLFGDAPFAKDEILLPQFEG